MPAGGADGFGMTAFAAYPLIKFTYMTLSHTLMMDSDRITCLTEGPFEVMINIAAKLAVTSLAAAAVNAGNHTAITAKTFGSGESAYIAKLQRYHHRQNKSNAGQRHKPFDLPGLAEYPFHPLLDPLYLFFNSVKLAEQQPECKGGFFWKLLDCYFNLLTASFTEDVTDTLEIRIQTVFVDH